MVIFICDLCKKEMEVNEVHSLTTKALLIPEGFETELEIEEDWDESSYRGQICNECASKIVRMTKEDKKTMELEDLKKNVTIEEIKAIRPCADDESCKKKKTSCLDCVLEELLKNYNVTR